MFEYHGWLTLRASPRETPTEDADLRAAVAEVDALFAAHADPTRLRDLRYMNGVPYAHVGGHANHRPPEFEELLAGLRDVVRRATGSYGLIHVHDDEAPSIENEIRVLVVRRGTITEHGDRFLSPLIPLVEDECFYDDGRWFFRDDAGAVVEGDV